MQNERKNFLLKYPAIQQPQRYTILKRESPTGGGQKPRVIVHQRDSPITVSPSGHLAHMSVSDGGNGRPSIILAPSHSSASFFAVGTGFTLQVLNIITYNFEGKL